MEKYELSKDWIRKNGSKIKKAYNVALQKDYDISSYADVLKILKIVDPDNALEDNAKVFSKVLQLFAQQLNRKLGPKKRVKAKILN